MEDNERVQVGHAVLAWRSLRWFKSSRSATHGCCVEVAVKGRTVGMRDSTDPDAGVLEFPRDGWISFIAAVKSGEFDLR
jgi:hypothetical protein